MICRHCGQSFEAEGRNATLIRYCSDKCRRIVKDSRNYGRNRTYAGDGTSEITERRGAAEREAKVDALFAASGGRYDD